MEPAAFCPWPERLPEEVLSMIFDRLGVEDLLVCRAVCRRWMAAADRDRHWRRVFRRRFRFFPRGRAPYKRICLEAPVGKNVMPPELRGRRVLVCRLDLLQLGFDKLLLDEGLPCFFITDACCASGEERGAYSLLMEFLDAEGEEIDTHVEMSNSRLDRRVVYVARLNRAARYVDISRSAAFGSSFAICVRFVERSGADRGPASAS
ncbi:ORF019 [Saltwater crocodilepox virus]|nr:F-box domain protein [Saltwater crocodilepox virus]QGT46458.1 ORF019 [Saltwater crocodilepox virus]QGT46674.1 ORF019 [Saltwater crocodilepox virus]QGT46891.1 ORF019 [Saltwater crocodilepox virus]QGT47104.1 ORF019 [Saltwater crocodilepox virus]